MPKQTSPPRYFHENCLREAVNNFLPVQSHSAVRNDRQFHSSQSTGKKNIKHYCMQNRNWNIK